MRDSWWSFLPHTFWLERWSPPPQPHPALSESSKSLRPGRACRGRLAPACTCKSLSQYPSRSIGQQSGRASRTSQKLLHHSWTPPSSYQPGSASKACRGWRPPQARPSPARPIAPCRSLSIQSRRIIRFGVCVSRMWAARREID